MASLKQSFVSDAGFLWGEADYSQAEARDTAYLSGDTALIAAVDDITRDFHGSNASKFFGLSYDSIISSVEGPSGWTHEVINKPIRQLAKRVNHGANYNMGPGVMLNTMGIANVLLAKKLLSLPARFSPLDVTTYLLKAYSDTYPTVKGAWYNKVKRDVDTTTLLVGPTGWTRKCFGHPSANKSDLNSYVAHPPQSLNAMILNKAVLRVFSQIAIPEHKNFKFNAQIHDSLLFQYRRDREDLAWRVAELMDMSIPVTDIHGITRQLRVPVDLKGGSSVWSGVTPLTRNQECSTIKQ